MKLNQKFKGISSNKVVFLMVVESEVWQVSTLEGVKFTGTYVEAKEVFDKVVQETFVSEPFVRVWFDESGDFFVVLKQTRSRWKLSFDGLSQNLEPKHFTSFADAEAVTNTVLNTVKKLSKQQSKLKRIFGNVPS